LTYYLSIYNVVIINYNKYLTYTCKNLECLPLFESKGISTTIKSFTNIIYNNLQKNITEYSIDIDEDDFKVKNLKILLKDSKELTYYGSCTFGDFKNDILIGSEILIRFNFDDWNISEIKRVITHELIHIYEIYKRVKKNSKVGLQWILIKKIQELRNDYNDDYFIHDLCLLIYYTSDQELNAIVAQVYPILYSLDSSDKDILYNKLLKTKSYEILFNMKNFNYKNYKIDYDRLLEFFIDLNTTMKNVSDKDFILFKIPTNINECDKILKKYQKLFIKKSLYLEKKLNKIIDEVINDVKNQN
jgi:hypothetical protein